MNPRAEAWVRIPAELRARPQWVCAGLDKMPLSVDHEGRFFAASTTDPRSWLPFEIAATHAYNHDLSIGYVLSADDPYTCIDFDVVDEASQRRKGQPIDSSKWTSWEEFHGFWNFISQQRTYVETSLWGKGLHVWVKGKLEDTGIKRSNVELYSKERYIICTGYTALDYPIEERTVWLHDLAFRMRSGENGPAATLVEVAQTVPDEVIVERLQTADNAGKANPLWEGKWSELGYPSQSEADLALMSMVAFYSESNEQCRRVFRLSGLGQRPKATKNNRYLDYTLRVIRTRQANSAIVKIDAIEKRLDEVNRVNGKAASLTNPDAAIGHPTAPPPAVVATFAAPTPEPVANAAGELPWPPGLAGHLAGFVYQSAPRPVKEVAIVAAVGILAGILGKSFHFSQSGLNLYLVLIARSAIGKEAMHSGISALCKAGLSRCPSIMRFINFTEFASGPALIKTCQTQDSFVQVSGEFGQRLKRLADLELRDSAIASLRTVMIDLYQKSGPQAMVGGITYSNQDNNIASISGVAYSMIGETTPKAFYEVLTEEIMENGFLSRFTMIEYEGERQPLNQNPLKEPPKYLADAFGSLAQYAEGVLAKGMSQEVLKSQEAAAIFQGFEIDCDKQINSTKDERWRQMWNRASLKVMRISALLAAADNWLNPVITKDHAEWALIVIKRDIELMSRRLKSGDVGNDDTTREQKVKAIIYDALVYGVTEGYGVSPIMLKDGVVPYSLLQKRTARVSAFYKHRNGSATSLKQTVVALIDGGYISELPKEETLRTYAFQGKCYRLAKSLQEFNQG